MAYVPDATNTAQPADTGVQAATAAAEFRTLKLYIQNTVIAGLAAKAPLASPALTGTPTAPTQAVDNNTTRIATTAYVVGQGYLKSATAATTYAPLASPTFTGTPAAPTATPGTNTTQLATTAFVVAADALKANLAGPALTGVPTAPTAVVDTNTTQIATTAYVVGNGYLKSASAASTYAPLASPSLTGTPTAPTATVDTNTTQLATTAYVVGNGYLKSATAASTYAPLASPALIGNPTATTQAIDNDTTRIATTAWVINQDYIKTTAANAAYPLKNGTGATGTWGINISGSAASATSASTATTATTATTASDVSAGGQVGGIEIGYRRLVAASVTTGSVAAADSSKCVYATGGVTIPDAVFQKGDTLAIYAGAAARTITLSITTPWLNGVDAGASKVLAARSLATILFISGTECVLDGPLT